MIVPLASDCRCAVHPLAFWYPAPDARHLNRHGSDARLHLPFRQVAMPDEPLATSGIGLDSMSGGKSIQLRLNRLRDELPRTQLQQICQRIR